MLRRPATALAGAALVLASCAAGGGDEQGSGAAAPGADGGAVAAPTPPGAVEGGSSTGSSLDGVLAPTVLSDVASGDEVTMADVIEGDRALLVWFWAPH